MEKRQREVQLELFNKEEMVKDRLQENYEAALKEVKNRIQQMLKDPGFRAKDIRHPKYLKMLEAQLETILHRLGADNVRDMTDYLTDVYQEAFLGCLYKMHGDGVDLILMVDEDKVIRCINKETKDFRFDNRLYENVKQLKDTVKSELARGFSGGKGYEWMARQIALKTSASFSRAYTIARTEGHRVTSESEMDCMTAAKEKGADVIKEWTSTLDNVTRQTHVELDGQQRELEEEFVIPSSGARAMYPGGFGIAGEDVNCRCCMNQRARWNLKSEEYRYSRAAGEVVSIKSDVYREWKKGYTEVVKGFTAEKHIFGGVEEHKPPEYVGKLDPASRKDAARIIASFEAKTQGLEYEKALVITAEGNIYECYGTEQNVYPNLDLGERIRGAVITHNHPAAYTEYSFSKEDCALFEEYDLQMLRGVDEKYIYELSRLHNETEALKSVFELSPEDGRNEFVKEWAAARGYGYSRRPVNDQGTD
ncbi:MAG: phage head morphogenesis protein [Butyrivibrio sp.]|nr:phage head morphogenesis protein [Acetatifactor muris]MCM1561101.1 phage head morphogenesis protein [Butyrivibrio sp.]